MNDNKIDSPADGFRFPDKSPPRAFGYLDSSGVEWAAYDTMQLEAYARVAYSDGFRAGFVDGMQSGMDAVMTPIYRAATVSDAMIDAAIAAYNASYKAGQREWMRDALIVALSGKSS